MNPMESSSGHPQSPVAHSLRAISFVVLAAVATVRPLIPESYDSAGTSISQAIDALADPLPVRTLIIDLVILAATAAWLLSFAFDSAIRYRKTGLEAGLGLLLVASVASCLTAGNKRLAINATVDWICLPILTITLVQLIQSRAHRRILLAAIVASAAVQAAQCYEQYYVGFAETIAQYESQREEFWARQGVELDSTTVDAFERRLRAREASGFLAHSNVTGSYLVLCTFAGLSMLAGGRASSGSTDKASSTLARVVAMAIVGAIGFAIWLTGSKAALLGGAVAAVMAGLIYWRREWIDRNRRLFFWGSWAAVALGAAAVIGHGLYHDSLPGWSLTFRWQYWKASAEMIADHFWTGVGRENFGRLYTMYKDIASPEEVSNPHNFVVQAMAEWGVAGLSGIILLMIRVTWREMETSTRKEDIDRRGTNADSESIHSLLQLVLVGGSVVVGRALLLGTSDENYMYYAAVTTTLIWFPAVVAFHFHGTANSVSSASALPRIFLGAGLAAFVLQDMAGFAFFVPASATTFFALLALWIVPENPVPTTVQERSGWKGGRLRWIGAIAAVGIVVTVAFAEVVPVSRSNRFLAEARQMSSSAREMRNDPAAVTAAFMRAAEADRLDPTPWIELARWQASIPGQDPLSPALSALERAIVRDPHNHALMRRRAQLMGVLAGVTGRAEDYIAAVQSAQAALRLYPQDPAGIARLADAEYAAGQATGSKPMLESAANHYEEALALDGRRLSWETIQRLRPRELEAIRRKLEQTRQLMDKPQS